MVAIPNASESEVGQSPMAGPLSPRLLALMACLDLGSFLQHLMLLMSFRCPTFTYNLLSI